MKKHKIIFAACVALFASICFLGCETEDEEVFTKISEFKPAAGTYDVEVAMEGPFEGTSELPEGISSMSVSVQASGTYVIEGTEDDSKVTQTYSSMISSVIMKFSSEEDYNATKLAFSSSSESSATVEYSFDDVNYTVTSKTKATETDLEAMSNKMTYSEFVDSVKDSADMKVEIYFSNRGNYKLVESDNSSKGTIILTLK